MAARDRWYNAIPALALAGSSVGMGTKAATPAPARSMGGDGDQGGSTDAAGSRGGGRHLNSLFSLFDSYSNEKSEARNSDTTSTSLDSKDNLRKQPEADMPRRLCSPHARRRPCSPPVSAPLPWSLSPPRSPPVSAPLPWSLSPPPLPAGADVAALVPVLALLPAGASVGIALYHLSLAIVNQSKIGCAMGGVRALLAVSTDVDDPALVKRLALMVACNVAACADGRIVLMDADAVATVTAVLSHEGPTSEDLQQWCVAAVPGSGQSHRRRPPAHPHC
ncbi:hypothetical protein PR202_ga12571 [Eleusine coracana subsp. coracana]|uniref:Uncharacterized protein n=1 Tax=Eleusine coracana subsp. coracana TaxID=191504 RepID=A0AAV5CBZ5_ELECO|nr:hypothetical protein PR202_ga12571 [Eleusine coracana subsp. coracana]